MPQPSVRGPARPGDQHEQLGTDIFEDEAEKAAASYADYILARKSSAKVEPTAADTDKATYQETERSYANSSEAVSIQTIPELYHAVAELLRQQEARLNQRMDESMRTNRLRFRKKASTKESKAGDALKGKHLAHIVEQVDNKAGATLTVHWEDMVKKSAQQVASAQIVRVDDRKRGPDDKDNKSSLVRQLWRYDMAIFAVIIANMIFLSLQVQDESQNGHSTAPYRILSVVFVVIFFLDIVARMVISPGLFFRGRDKALNWIDVLVVTGMIVDEVISLLGDQWALTQLSVLRVFRLLRIVRILRILRFARHFIEFQVFCAVLQSSALWRSLLVVILFGSIVIFGCALAMTTGAQGVCAEINGSETDHEVCQYFGSFGKSFQTLVEVMLNGTDWGAILKSTEKLLFVYPVMLFFFVAFCYIMFSNMIIGLMVKVVQDARSRLSEVNTQDNLAEQEFYIQSLMELFMTIDVNSSGSITADELELAMTDKYTAMLLSSLHLDVHDVARIFSVMDQDQSKEIDLREFVTGCMRLRGTASAAQMSIMHFDLEKLAVTMCEMETRLIDLEEGFQEEEDIFDETTTNIETLNTAPGKHVLFDAFRPMDHEEYLIVRDRHHTGRPIDRVEMRAMSLAELQNVRTLIHDHCKRDGWLDQFTGHALAPQDVNLYQLNYYVVCFLTAPKTITLKGLTVDADRMQNGDQVGQTDGNYRVAAGQVVRVTDAGELEVVVFRGRFESTSNGRTFNVAVNNECVGECSEVVAPGSISYKEYVSSKETKPDWYASHWWGESVFDFVQGCELHTRHRGLSNQAAYWVCAYANRQYGLGADISDDLDSCSFVKAMNASEGVLLLLDPEGTAFSRIWCGFELIRTCTDSTKLLDIVAVRMQNGSHVPALLTDGVVEGESLVQKQRRERYFPLSPLVIGLRCTLEEGKATMEQDRQNILDYVEHRAAQDGLSREEALDNANSILHYLLGCKAWPQALKRGLVHDLDTNNPGALSLPRIMSACPATRIELNMGLIDEVCDEDLTAIGDGLPTTLAEVYLNFYMCKNITNHGVESLARRLPKNMRVLRLDFLGCKQVTDLGLTQLGRNLPASLQELRLDFGTCPRITSTGVLALQSNLPKSITKFGATFVGTEVDRNFRSRLEFDQFCLSKEKPNTRKSSTLSFTQGTRH